jgi:hypothetical protein
VKQHFIKDTFWYDFQPSPSDAFVIFFFAFEFIHPFHNWTLTFGKHGISVMANLLSFIFFGEVAHLVAHLVAHPPGGSVPPPIKFFMASNRISSVLSLSITIFRIQK